MIYIIAGNEQIFKMAASRFVDVFIFWMMAIFSLL